MWVGFDRLGEGIREGVPMLDFILNFHIENHVILAPIIILYKF